MSAVLDCRVISPSIPLRPIPPKTSQSRKWQPFSNETDDDWNFLLYDPGYLIRRHKLVLENHFIQPFPRISVGTPSAPFLSILSIID
jgi:hypothetical protein